MPRECYLFWSKKELKWRRPSRCSVASVIVTRRQLARKADVAETNCRLQYRQQTAGRSVEEVQGKDLLTSSRPLLFNPRRQIYLTAICMDLMSQK